MIFDARRARVKGTQQQHKEKSIMTTAIRKLYTAGTSLVSTGVETAKEVFAPAITGLALGALAARAKGGLDSNGVPLDAVGGFALRTLQNFGLTERYLPKMFGIKEFVRHNGSDIAAAAIAVGASRVGHKMAGGKATMHGDGTWQDNSAFGPSGFTPTLGTDPLAAAASRL
jgi:hypothetical protein